MIIRRAEEKDLNRLNDLLFQVLNVHHNGRPDLFKSGAKKYTDEELLQIINNDKKPIFVATDEKDKVMGYAFCIIIQNENDNILTDIKTLYIDDLCVDENVRGKHIGKSIYEYVTKYAKENGFYNVTLNVWSCNKSAMKFYEKCGLLEQKRTMEIVL